MKRITSIILALVMLLSCLAMTACGDRTPPALTLEGHKVTEAQYSYWASSYKANYLNSYEDVETAQSTGSLRSAKE